MNDQEIAAMEAEVRAGRGFVQRSMRSHGKSLRDHLDDFQWQVILWSLGVEDMALHREMCGGPGCAECLRLAQELTEAKGCIERALKALGFGSTFRPEKGKG